MSMKAHLCPHHMFTLKGCNRLRGHEGLHRNIFDKFDERWSDEQGMNVETQDDWVKLVDLLGK